MDKRQLAGAACLLVTASAVAVLARPDVRLHGDLVMEQPAPRVREELRAHFSRYYREAACSAVYVDLNHDGAEELLVVELEPDEDGRRILLHDGPIDPDRFTRGTVTVLGVGETGVEPWLEEQLSGEEPGGWYLVPWDGEAYLLHYAPADGGSRFRAALFCLDDAGEPQILLEETWGMTSGDDAAALLPLLEQGSAVLACGAAPDGGDRFAYLDDLFTTYGD